MNEPATDKAVQTTLPMIKAANIPPAPFIPMAAIMTEARIKVISVMPETGFEPTMAMAFAATVVNRNAMIVTRSIATIAYVRLFITPNQKNTNVTMMAQIEPIPIILNDISLRVRSSSVFAFPPPLISFAANPTALRMIPHDLMMPITPAMAMPPMPMLRA